MTPHFSFSLSPPPVLQSALHRIRHGRTGSRLANLHCQHQHVSMWPARFTLIPNDNDNGFHFRSTRAHSALRLHRLIAASFFFFFALNHRKWKGWNERQRPPPTPLSSSFLPPCTPPTSAFYASPSPLIPTRIQGEKISSEIKFPANLTLILGCVFLRW